MVLLFKFDRVIWSHRAVLRNLLSQLFRFIDTLGRLLCLLLWWGNILLSRCLNLHFFVLRHLLIKLKLLNLSLKLFRFYQMILGSCDVTCIPLLDGKSPLLLYLLLELFNFLKYIHRWNKWLLGFATSHTHYFLFKLLQHCSLRVPSALSFFSCQEFVKLENIRIIFCWLCSCTKLGWIHA